MKKQILLFLTTVIFAGIAMAQVTRTVTGKVLSESDKSELIGASIAIKGGQALGATDADGNFSIEVPANQTVTIEVSYTGYLAKTVTIRPTDKTIAVSLVQDKKSALEDVVVTVGYAKQKKALVLGSVVTVKAEDIEDIPAANLATALIGRVPGVSISQTSGKPGSTTNLTIRNPNSFSGSAGSGTNEPLFVIDGFQMTKQDFDNLDATLVESISFLKDAAASIYGARGANGVVLVTTKRGKPGRLKISYTGNYGISSAVKFPEMLSSYDHAKLLNAKFATYANGNQTMYPKQFYTEQELEYLKTHDYDRVDRVWESSHLNRQTINVSGGTERVSIFAGANYYDEKGNLANLYVKKYGVRFGTNVKITSDLTASVSLATDFSQLNRPAPKGPLGNNVTEQGDQLNGTISSLLLTPRWVPLEYNGLPVGITNLVPWNPLELQRSGSYARNRSQGFNLNASIDYNVPVIKGLSAKVQYGLSTRNGFGKEYYVPYQLAEFEMDGVHNAIPVGAENQTYSRFNLNSQNVVFTDNYTLLTVENGNFISEDHSSGKNYQLNEMITYARKFGEHDLSIFAGAEQSENSGENFKVQIFDVQVRNVDELFAFSSDRNRTLITGNSSENGRMSYFGRLNYNFNGRYLFEGTFRADASPNFPPETRWGNFYSFAAGWVVSEENFFKNLFPYINNLKFRYQNGLTGNDNVSNFQYRLTYGTSTGYLFGTTLGGGVSPTANRTSVNPVLTWEKARYNNFGVDGSVFDRRLSFSIDYYRRYNYDMADEPTNTIPTTAGAVISDINNARMRSWGTEGSLTWADKIGSKFRYSITTNFGWSDNKLLQKFVGAADTGYKNRIGRRIDSGIEGLVATGIVRSQSEVNAFNASHPGYKINGDTLRPGYMTFQDINGDGVITDADRTRIVNRSGSRVGMSFNINLAYGDLKLSTNISYSIGGKVAYDKTVRTPPTETQNGLAIWNDSWTPENPNAKYPVINAKYITEVYDMWIVDASVMRVNNMTLSYALPARLATRYKIPQFRAYITGTNLWDIINHRPYKYSASNVAVDYPALRTFTFALNVNI